MWDFSNWNDRLLSHRQTLKAKKNTMTSLVSFITFSMLENISLSRMCIKIRTMMRNNLTLINRSFQYVLYFISPDLKTIQAQKLRLFVTALLQQLNIVTKVLFQICNGFLIIWKYVFSCLLFLFPYTRHMDRIHLIFFGVSVLIAHRISKRIRLLFESLHY